MGSPQPVCLGPVDCGGGKKGRRMSGVLYWLQPTTSRTKSSICINRLFILQLNLNMQFFLRRIINLQHWSVNVAGCPLHERKEMIDMGLRTKARKCMKE